MSRHSVHACYCVLRVLGFNYLMTVPRRWAPVRGALPSSRDDDDDDDND